MYTVHALMESEIKNGDQQTEALKIDFVIDLEMYRNWQKMEDFDHLLSKE